MTLVSFIETYIDVFYPNWWKLSALIENCIMEGVRSPNIFPNMLWNTFLDFVSDTGVTDHRHYDR